MRLPRNVRLFMGGVLFILWAGIIIVSCAECAVALITGEA
jgi:hypothetical protein